MSKRTDDLAEQARNRAQAEQRSQSRQGNSDAAESPSALRREQERKAAERSGGPGPFDRFDPEVRAAQERAQREAADEERKRQDAASVVGRTEGEAAPAVEGHGSDQTATPAPLHHDARHSPDSPPTAPVSEPAKAG